MAQQRDDLTTKLQAAIDAARDLAQAAQRGVPASQLDDLANKVIQLTGAFRAALKLGLVHWRSACPEMGYDGPACLDDGGRCTTDRARVTCPKCRAALP